MIKDQKIELSNSPSNFMSYVCQKKGTNNSKLCLKNTNSIE